MNTIDSIFPIIKIKCESIKFKHFIWFVRYSRYNKYIMNENNKSAKWKYAPGKSLHRRRICWCGDAVCLARVSSRSTAIVQMWTASSCDRLEWPRDRTQPSHRRALAVVRTGADSSLHCLHSEHMLVGSFNCEWGVNWLVNNIDSYFHFEFEFNKPVEFTKVRSEFLNSAKYPDPAKKFVRLHAFQRRNNHRIVSFPKDMLALLPKNYAYSTIYMLMIHCYIVVSLFNGTNLKCA